MADKPIASTGLEDSLTTTPAGYTTDGKTLYWIDSRGRNTAALVAVDTETGKQTVLAENPKADIGGTLVKPGHPARSKLIRSNISRQTGPRSTRR